jgi:Ribbon-helix-helix protein, copG family.
MDLQKDQPAQMYSFRLATAVKAQLEELAKERGTDVSSLVRLAIDVLINDSIEDESEEQVAAVCAGTKRILAEKMEQGSFARTTVLDSLNID